MQRKLIAIVIFILIVRCGFYFANLEKPKEGTLRIKGRVASEPTMYDSSQGISLGGYSIYIPLHSSVSLGDTLIVEGEAKDGVIKKGKIIFHEESSNPLYNFRKKLLAFYSSVLPGESAALVSGTTIGSKQLLTRDFWDTLTATGTAHVVVASGMNVTIVSKFVLDLLVCVFPRRKAIPFALSGVWVYALLAGFGAPIVRAGIMGSITFTAQELGYLSYALRAFFLTSVSMLLVKPEWLFDVSFLLTCTATLAILLLQKPIENKLKRVPQIVKTDFSTSLAASIGVAPILWWNFDQFNIFSPFINTLVLWTIAPITLVGGVGGIVGVIFEPLGRLFLYLIYPLCWWFVSIVTIFS